MPNTQEQKQHPARQSKQVVSSLRRRRAFFIARTVITAPGRRSFRRRRWRRLGQPCPWRFRRRLTSPGTEPRRGCCRRGGRYRSTGDTADYSRCRRVITSIPPRVVIRSSSLIRYGRCSRPTEIGIRGLGSGIEGIAVTGFAKRST